MIRSGDGMFVAGKEPTEASVVSRLFRSCLQLRTAVCYEAPAKPSWCATVVAQDEEDVCELGARVRGRVRSAASPWNPSFAHPTRQHHSVPFAGLSLQKLGRSGHLPPNQRRC